MTTARPSAATSSDVRALTLYPEHAELFRLGLRTIETRSKRTHYRGRLLLHAGVRDEHSAVAQRSPRTRAALDAMPHGDPLTRGAVVASCQLVDCVPMVADYNNVANPYDGPAALEITPNEHLILYPEWSGALEAEDERDVTAERPFGDFSPGRWAWLLDDVKPTTERCPRCWGGMICPGYHGTPDDPAPCWGHFPCPTCRADASGAGCDPVPMRGRQGLWTPKPSDWPAAA